MRGILLCAPNYMIVTGIKALIHAQKNLHLMSDNIWNPITGKFKNEMRSDKQKNRTETSKWWGKKIKT
jgi:hypothetical protein